MTSVSRRVWAQAVHASVSAVSTVDFSTNRKTLRDTRTTANVRVFSDAVTSRQPDQNVGKPARGGDSKEGACQRFLLRAPRGTSDPGWFRSWWNSASQCARSPARAKPPSSIPSVEVVAGRFHRSRLAAHGDVRRLEDVPALCGARPAEARSQRGCCCQGRRSGTRGQAFHRGRAVESGRDGPLAPRRRRIARSLRPAVGIPA